jgi:Tol biopolymer transport system component
VWRRTLDPQSEFAWLDRTGRKLGRLGEPGPWHNFDLSPDGKRVIAATRRQRASASLFLIDTERGVTAPARDSADPASDPTFSPDGTRIAYRVRNTLVVRAAQGGPETVLLNSTAYPDSWSRDGRFLTFGMARLGSYDGYVMEVDKPDQPPVLIVKGNPRMDEPRFSPDGRWVAYESDETGPREIVVRAFGSSTIRAQVSLGGGTRPEWSPNGRELYYVSADYHLMAVSLRLGAVIEPDTPRPLFEIRRLERVPSWPTPYAVSPDGQRFLVGAVVDEGSGSPMSVVLNWTRLFDR